MAALPGCWPKSGSANGRNHVEAAKPKTMRKIMFIACCVLAARLNAESFDVVVCGGTPGGIAAAVTAARLGRTVALVEYQAHLGGMSASGLGKSDIETR